MARRLLDLALDEISLVDSPANPGAKIFLVKRAVQKDGDEAVACRLCDTPVGKDDKFCKGCGAPFYKAEWDAGYINDLPDSSFAVIAPGGTKDDEGKTTPRSLRHLPYKDKEGKVNLPHLRNALSRLPQTSLSEADKANAKTKLEAAASAAGIGKKKEKSMADEKTLTIEAEVEKLLSSLNPSADGDDKTLEARTLKALAVKLVSQKRLAEFTKKAEALQFLPGTTTATLAELLKDVSEQAPEVYAKVEALLKSCNDAIEMSALFSEKGSGGDESATAQDRVEALAQDRIKKGLAKTLAQAQEQVFRADPALYRQYRKEMSIAV